MEDPEWRDARGWGSGCPPQSRGDLGGAGQGGFPEELTAEGELEHEPGLAQPREAGSSGTEPRQREDGGKAWKCNQHVCVCVCVCVCSGQ